MAAPDGRPRVLTVSDVPARASALQSALLRARMVAELASGAQEARTLLERFRPEVAVIDFALADGAGGELARDFAAAGCLVLAIADAVEPEGAVHDHVAPPLHVGEVVARVRALHRRMAGAGAAIEVGQRSRSLSCAGAAAVMLEDAEFHILITLIEARGTAVSREWLARVAVPGVASDAAARVDALVLSLRRQLAALGAGQSAIRAVRGQGYVLADPAMFRSVEEG